MKEGSELAVAGGAPACNVLRVVARAQEDNGVMWPSCDVGDGQRVRDRVQDVGEIDDVKWECLSRRAWTAANAEVPEVISTLRDENIVVRAFFGEDEEAGLPARGYVRYFVPGETMVFQR